MVQKKPFVKASSSLIADLKTGVNMSPLLQSISFKKLLICYPFREKAYEIISWYILIAEKTTGHQQ